MGDKSIKNVEDLKKGDVISTIENKTAQVICVIKTRKNNGVADLCILPSGLKITKHHPILHEGLWVYPSDLSQPISTPCEFVYNLVVDQGHVAIVNNTPLILLGHNYTEGVLNHPYLGTKKVIEDLAKMPGFGQGLV